MSRMLGWVPRADPTATPGADVLERFIAMSVLHSDGWGTAWSDGRTVHATTSTEPAAQLAGVAASGGTARTLYLRFGSLGSAVAPENAQPFLRAGLAFQHNGLLAPRSALVDTLTDEERASLQGTTDSEVYFRVVQSELTAVWDSDDAEAVAERIARAVMRVRTLYPGACLNAFVVTADALFVVQSSGGASVPLESFARRGFTTDQLPAGHDENYNRMVLSVGPDITMVGNSGLALPASVPLPEDSVTWIGRSADVHNLLIGAR